MLLRTRVLSVSEYRDEVRRGHKTPNAPIAVPLFPGETVEEYERRFRAFLPTLSMDLTRLADEPNTERSVRLLFARKRLTGGPPPPLPAPPNGRVVQVALASDVSKPSILSRVSDAPANVETDSVENTTVVTQAREQPMDSMLHFPTTCSLRPPPADADEAALPKVYLACGCRKCLLRCTSRLVRQVTQLQRDVDASASSATTHTVMDLTRDTDSSTSSTASAVPPSPSPSTRIDVAKMLQFANLVQRRPHAVSLTVSHDDPVETQLRQQYDEINERVVVNERVLETASLQLQDAALGELAHVQAAAQTQDENLELRQYIDEEKDQRDAALAMLVVYTWRHTLGDLQARLARASATAVAHVTRACHHKCAALATDLSDLTTKAAAHKAALDAVLSREEMDETERLEELARLGHELTTAETAIAAIHQARHRELGTLVHFDSHVRRVVIALLDEASSCVQDLTC